MVIKSSIQLKRVGDSLHVAPQVRTQQFSSVHPHTAHRSPDWPLPRQTTAMQRHLRDPSEEAKEPTMLNTTNITTTLTISVNGHKLKTGEQEEMVSENTLQVKVL